MANYWSKLTAEERSAEMKRRVAKRNKTLKRKKRTGKAVTLREHSEHPQAEGASLEAHIAYLSGRAERDIERYALSNGLPYPALAAGVSAVLRHSAGR